MIVDGNTTFNTPSSSSPFNVSNSNLVNKLNAQYINGYSYNDFLLNNAVIEDIPDGVDNHTFNFYESKPNTNYSLSLEMCNLIDSTPSLYTWIITNKTVDNFSIKFSGIIDSSNYKMTYIIY